MLRNEIAPAASAEQQTIKYFDDPEAAAKNIFQSPNPPVARVDGLIDASKAAVHPLSKSLSTLMGMELSLIVGMQPVEVVHSICEIIHLPHPERVVEPGKLKVSLDLYSAFFRETSANAKFLTLALALEALLPDELRSDALIAMINQWIDQVRATKVATEDAVFKSELTSLEGGLRFQKYRSISKKIREMIGDTLARGGYENPAGMARRAVEVYGDRSKLVHEGFLPPDQLGAATSDLKDILQRVLSVLFSEAAKN
jgi:hypothetical protein